MLPQGRWLCLPVIAAGEQAAAFERAADTKEIVLELKLEDDEWKVVRAAWQSTRRG